MRKTSSTQWMKRTAATMASLTLGILATTGAHAEDKPLDSSVMQTLQDCRKISSSCADTTNNAPGILVFPSVVKADIIVGGAGGKGALIENGKITGYYNIGAGSAGLQVGVEHTSQVYIFRTQEALTKLKEGPDWKVGATADVALVTTAANSSNVSGNVLAYVFDSKGLNAGVSLDLFDVWRSSQHRPS